MPRPGEKCEKGGIYKCSKCDTERAIGQGDTFPPCSDCNKSGVIWILVRPSRN